MFLGGVACILYCSFSTACIAFGTPRKPAWQAACQTSRGPLFSSPLGLFVRSLMIFSARMGIRSAPFRACPPAANQQAEHALSLQQREMPQPLERVGHLSSCRTGQERSCVCLRGGWDVGVGVAVGTHLVRQRLQHFALGFDRCRVVLLKHFIGAVSHRLAHYIGGQGGNAACQRNNRVAYAVEALDCDLPATALQGCRVLPAGGDAKRLE